MFLSALSTLNFSLAFLVGVLSTPLTFVRQFPEKTPAALRFKPGGSDPPMSDQVSALRGGLPPSAASVAEYGCPVTANGKVVVVTISEIGGVVAPC